MGIRHIRSAYRRNFVLLWQGRVGESCRRPKDGLMASYMTYTPCSRPDLVSHRATCSTTIYIFSGGHRSFWKNIHEYFRFSMPHSTTYSNILLSSSQSPISKGISIGSRLCSQSRVPFLEMLRMWHIALGSDTCSWIPTGNTQLNLSDRFYRFPSTVGDNSQGSLQFYHLFACITRF